MVYRCWSVHMFPSTVDMTRVRLKWVESCMTRAMVGGASTEEVGVLSLKAGVAHELLKRSISIILIFMGVVP